MEKKLTLSPKMAYKTKQEYVYQVLREAIMQCELIPYQKLIISEIAKQLGVSTIPVREALQLLQSEDLVNYNAHSGAIVSPITQASIVETFNIKEALESVATRNAVQQLTNEYAEDLRKQLAEMDEALISGKEKGWGPLNEKFHCTIVQVADMPVLKEMHSKIMDKWERIRRYFFSEVLSHRHHQSQEEHYAILKAMEEKDSEKAEKSTRLHNQNALKDYMAYFDENDN